MSETTSNDSRGIDGLPNWVRRTWLVPLVLGIPMLILGLVLVFNIRAGIDTLRWLVVFALIFAAVEAFATASLRTKPWVGWLVGIAYLVGARLSIACLNRPDAAGSGDHRGRFASRRRDCPSDHGLGGEKATRGWGWSFAFGLLSAVAGLVFPFGSPLLLLVVLAILLAIYVIMTGATLIALALAVRKATQAIAAS